MTKYDEQLESIITELRPAADQLEQIKGKSPDETEKAMTDMQCCCGAYTAISELPSCKGSCMRLPVGAF